MKQEKFRLEVENQLRTEFGDYFLNELGYESNPKRESEIISDTYRFENEDGERVDDAGNEFSFESWTSGYCDIAKCAESKNFTRHSAPAREGEKEMTEYRKYQAQNSPFYARANGALKGREVQDGYSLTTHYGHTALTTYFAGLDDMAEYIYFTAANESDTVLSIMRELEKALKEARLK